MYFHFTSLSPGDENNNERQEKEDKRTEDDISFNFYIVYFGNSQSGVKKVL